MHLFYLFQSKCHIFCFSFSTEKILVWSTLWGPSIQILFHYRYDILSMTYAMKHLLHVLWNFSDTFLFSRKFASTVEGLDIAHMKYHVWHSFLNGSSCRHWDNDFFSSILLFWARGGVKEFILMKNMCIICSR